MIVEPGTMTVTLTPELRRLALNHVRETEDGEEGQDLITWFQEQETPDGHVLDASSSESDAHMIVVIARAVLWEYDRCPECRRPDAAERGHVRGCAYDDR